MKRNRVPGKVVSRALLGLGLLLGSVLVLPTSGFAQCLTPRGDLNGDGTTNVVDLQCGIYAVLNGLNNIVAPPACLAYPLAAVDIDCNNNLDVSDLLVLIYHAVELPLDISLDADGDFCPDACEIPDMLDAGVGSFAGQSVNSKFKLTAIASGFESGSSSANSNFTLRPQAVGIEPATGE